MNAIQKSCKSIMAKISIANKESFNKLCGGKPVLYDVRPAGDVLPILRQSKMILHAGPPIAIGRLCGPVRGAIECALVYEAWTKTYAEAKEMLQSGEIVIEPTHKHQFVGPVAGIVSPSMRVFCVKNEEYGNWAYCTMSEGIGRALRFGAQGDDVIKRLKWMHEVLGPVLSEAVRRSGGLDLREMIRSGLEMGDECHNRHEGARLLFLRQILPHLLDSRVRRKTVREICEFIANNYYFFVNISMVACKAMTDAIGSVQGSSIVTTMARNGTDFGIRVAGLGERWFTAACNRIKGNYFEGFSEEDGNLDLGDSTITETAGIGAFAMAAAPAISRYIGGSPQGMVEHTMKMYQITHGEHPIFKIPFLGYRGTPTGIDVQKVVTTGITPIINTSIAHKEAGIGQIGAGMTNAPLQCFVDALEELERMNIAT